MSPNMEKEYHLSTSLVKGASLVKLQFDVVAKTYARNLQLGVVFFCCVFYFPIL